MSIILLTGPKGCGKTTACGKLAAASEIQTAGVLAPAIYDDAGIKQGIMMRNMATDEERRLATVVPVESGEVTVGQYAFDDTVTAWGLQAILEGLASAEDLVFVDEIGPLELWKRAGFWPALEALDGMQARNAILIVRPSLVHELSQRLAHLHPQVVTLSLENRDQVPDTLSAAIGYAF